MSGKRGAEARFEVEARLGSLDAVSSGPDPCIFLFSDPRGFEGVDPAIKHDRELRKTQFQGTTYHCVIFVP